MISGINKCDPTNAEWTSAGGYDEDCCTTSNPCGEKQGGCSSDGECGGGYLVCSDSSTGCGSNFDTASGQKCCHIKGNNNESLQYRIEYVGYYYFNAIRFWVNDCCYVFSV